MSDAEAERRESVEVPVVHEGEVAAAWLDDYARDLAALAEDVRTRLRRRSGPDLVDHPLESCLLAIRDGGGLALQVRYRLEGRTWCDTLVPAGIDLPAPGPMDGRVRVVRTAVPG